MAKGRGMGMKNSKPGPKSVDPASRGGRIANTTGGYPGKSGPQKPIPGPSSPGQPIARRKALKIKSNGTKGTSFPGLVK